MDEKYKARVLSMIKVEGSIIPGLDGYYVYWPERLNGGLTPELLRLIADELDQMNADWDRQVREELSKPKSY